MAKRKKLRRRETETLGDLVGGDTVILETFDGDVEVRVSFAIGDVVFVRPLARDGDLDSYSGNHPIKSIVKLQRTIALAEIPTKSETDPLLGGI